MHDTIVALHITAELVYEEGQKILYLHWWYQTFVIRLDGSDSAETNGNGGTPPLSGELSSISA